MTSAAQTPKRTSTNPISGSGRGVSMERPPRRADLDNASALTAENEWTSSVLPFKRRNGTSAPSTAAD